jgi:uncharacterized protein
VIAIGVLFLSIILALLSGRVQSKLQTILAARPIAAFLTPVLLTALFCGIAAALGALTAPLAALVLAYTLVPTICAFLRWNDLLTILLLWLPLEFSAGRSFVPKPVQGTLHTAAYGVALTLALTLFLLFRRLDGMKYNWPRNRWDLLNPLIGFAVLTPVIIPIGRAIGFLPAFHAPAPWFRPLGEFPLILAATALPEEILFRSLIQNALMQRLGSGTGTLILAAVVFGCAHLDNGPGPLPNWRYMIAATLAGFAYGKVFQKSSSVFASAGLHALVNTIKHSCF